jgi:MFS family permease
VDETASEQALRRNLRVAALNAALTGLCFRLVNAVWQPFVLSLGAPMTTLGFLESVGGFRGILTALIQYASGWLSDRRGRKLFIALGGLSGLSAAVLFITAGLTADWRWLLPGVVLAGAAYMADPAQQSLVAESTPARKRGTAFSVVMLAWTIPGIFAPTLGGYVADRWGYVPVFGLQAIFYGLGLVLVARYLRETLRAVARHVDPRALGQAMLKVFVPPRQLRGLYWVLGIDSFVYGLGFALLYGMLSETYGFTTLQLGIMSSMISLAWALSQLPVGKLIDRFGSKPLMIFSELLSIPVIAGWMLFRTFPAFIVLFALFGVTAATWVPAQTALVANSVEEDKRGEAMGRMAAFKGLVGFPAPFIGGLLYDQFGYQAPILANLLGVVLSTVLLLLFVHEPPGEDEMPVVEVPPRSVGRRLM